MALTLKFPMRSLNNPYAISGAVTASYFVFYTAYDKGTKKLVFANLYHLVSGFRGLDWSLVEINKAISLSGLTTMLISFLPGLESQKRELLWISMNMLWIHSVYSMYKWYGFNPKKIWKDKTIKQLSIALGSAGQLALSAGYWGFISEPMLVLTSAALGIGHFWTMEVDYKYVLQVRPYAYLPFPLAIASLYLYFKNKGGFDVSALLKIK